MQKYRSADECAVCMGTCFRSVDDSFIKNPIVSEERRMKRYIYIIGIVWLSFIGSLHVYATDKGAGKHDVEMADVWDNWYVQLGLDMSLQNPYGYDLAKVFPNGKTFGVNAAIGRWFTP